MIRKINKEFNRLRTFSQFKIRKFGEINKILDKKANALNNLFTDLKKLATPVEPLQNFDFILEKKERMNKTDSVINIKEKAKSTKNKNNLKLRINKSLKYNFSFNFKNDSLIKTCTNNDSKTQNKISFNIKSPLKDKEIHYYKISPINMKQSKFFINNNFQEKNLFKKKLNTAKKITYEIEDSKNNHQYNTLSNNKNDESNHKTFITQQKIDIGRRTNTRFRKKNFLERDKLINSNINKLKTQQSFFKHLSKEILPDYINSSSNIFNQQYNKFLEDEEVVTMAINNIKNMLEENEKRKSANRKLYVGMTKDINIPKIKKSMKLFKQSFKGKISFKENDLFKSSMITKKVADIVNCWDTFSRINDIYFYRNKKAFFKVYPPLSQRAIIDPLDDNYQLKYIRMSQKNKIKKNITNLGRFSV